MCGIVGRAGPLALHDEKILKILLLLDYLRGQDSTGVAAISKKGYPSLLKIADDPIMLFKHAEYDHTICGAMDAIWIGHNRAATIGGTTRANAHPFECEHIIGVHNGTLEKASLKELEDRLPYAYGTDSETLYQHMAIYGVEETVSRLEGAWALVWYDLKEKTLNMLRNDKRPLFTCEVTRGTERFMTWASEYEMIVAARVMANAPDGTLKTDDEGYGFFPLPTNQLHTWTLDQILEGNFTAKVEPMFGKPQKVVTIPATPQTYKPRMYESVEDQVNLVEAPFNEQLILGEFDEEEWEEMTRYGCSCCGGDIDVKEEGLIVCVNEGAVICPDCSGETKTTIYNAYSAANLINVL